ncbi:MAG: saccharopine dehydrogenase NADP-binding domain-containing protein [Candidatus Bathyarchaeia archaeon]
MKVTVLGGAGTIGSMATRILALSGMFSEVIIGDVAFQRAKKLASEIGVKGVSAVKIDVTDSGRLQKTIKGSDVILSCVGPFYKYAPIVLKASIMAGVNHVDICDDVDATEALLKMDAEAKKAGISALIGMGSSPGVANVLVKFCADMLLDEVEAIDIYHAHGGEETEGPAVVKHRIHSMIIPVPMFLDGEFKTVKVLEESGKALEEDVEFADVGTYRVYAYPHPETITLPRYIKGVRRVTNLGLVLPPSYAELIKGIVRLGMTSEEPIEVNGKRIAPIDFAVAFALHQRPKLLKEAGITEPMGCLKIVVKGRKKGQPSTYVFSMSSRGMGMREGTGVPAALGTMLMAMGKIKLKGVFPPEAAVDPIELFTLAKEKIRIGGTVGLPIRVEHIDKDGKVHKLSLESLVKGP